MNRIETGEYNVLMPKAEGEVLGEDTVISLGYDDPFDDFWDCVLRSLQEDGCL